MPDGPTAAPANRRPGALAGAPGARRWVASLGGAALILLCGVEHAAPQTPPSPAQNALAGAQVFGSKGCGECHAVNGLGATVGPDLARIAERRSFYDLGAALWNHLPRMAAQMREMGIARPRMTAKELGDLIAFLFTLDYFDRPGDARAGERLFASKQCIRCHQVGGVGGVVGPNLDFLEQYGTPTQIATAMWNHGPQMAEALRERGIARPTFTATELRNLIAYLESGSGGVPAERLYVLPGRADIGRTLFEEKRCVVCHSVAGRGGNLGPALARRGRESLIGFAAAMWNKGPRMTAAMRQRDIPIPQLRADEMADIVAYLYSVRYFTEVGEAARGQQLVVSQGCLRCHSLAGRGGGAAGDLARARGLGSAAAVMAALWNHAFLEAEPERWSPLRPAQLADLAAFFRERARP